MNGVFSAIDESCLEDYRPGYTALFIRHFAAKFEWTEDLTKSVTRDALRFLSVSAIPANSDTADVAQVSVCSPMVDKIVDAIFMDSPLLVWLERNIFHARMLHVPAYAHGITDRAITDLRYEFTVRLMQAAGYELDREVIWPYRLPVDYATCTCGNDLDDCMLYAVPLSEARR